MPLRLPWKKELSNRYYDLVNQIDILNEKIDNTTNDDEIEIYSEKIERLDGDIENIYDSAREIIEEEEYKDFTPTWCSPSTWLLGQPSPARRTTRSRRRQTPCSTLPYQSTASKPPRLSTRRR
mgnify:CR=1 FL=1